MSGLRSMHIAAGLLGVGALTVLGLGAGDSAGVLLSSTAMVGGGVPALAGLAVWMWGRNRSPRGRAAHRSPVDITLLIRSMAAVAASDRQVDAAEIAMIEDVSAGLLGEGLPRPTIEKALRRTAGKNAVDQIARLARDATPEGIELAVKGAVWAGRADGALTPAEMHVVTAIATVLGVSGHRLRTCIAEADHVFDRLTAHDASGR